MSNTDGLKQIGRLAMRKEGSKWVAYYAEPNTMECAVELGRIAIGLVTDNQERRERFMQLMADCLDEIVTEATGTKPLTTGFEAAPENER